MSLHVRHRAARRFPAPPPARRDQPTVGTALVTLRALWSLFVVAAVAVLALLAIPHHENLIARHAPSLGSSPSDTSATTTLDSLQAQDVADDPSREQGNAQLLDAIVQLTASWTTEDDQNTVLDSLIEASAEHGMRRVLGILETEAPVELYCEFVIASRPADKSAARYLLRMLHERAQSEATILQALSVLDCDADVAAELIRALDGTEHRAVVLDALRGFGALASGAATQLVALSHDDTWHRDAIETLLAVDPPGAVPVLLQSLQSDASSERLWGADCIARVGPAASSAVPRLAVLLSDPIPEVRAQAAFSLWLLGDVGRCAMPQLIDATKDVDADVRRNALQALEVMRAETSDALSAMAVALLREEDSYFAARALVASVHACVAEGAAVLRGMADERAKVRVNCAGVYWHLTGYAGVVLPVFRCCLQNHEMEVRIAAAEYLGRMGAEARDAIPMLEQRLNAAQCEAERDTVERAIAAIASCSHNDPAK